MLIHICDRCHEEIKGPKYLIEAFKFIIDGNVKYQIAGREFCSLGCMQAYIISGLKTRGHAEHIKV